MNSCPFSFGGIALEALGSGALWWPDARVLCVSDLHLCKSERMMRRGGAALPPYDTLDTLTRLRQEIDRTRPDTVICLGDSFDDRAAADALSDQELSTINQMQAGRQWIWIEGNHDPGPIDVGGTHLASFVYRGLTFRHIATSAGHAEVSGHYHPKATLLTRGRAISRPAFLYDATRLILPAFGTYTGGLRSDSATLDSLMQPDARAILTGQRPVEIPMPRARERA